MTVWIQNPFDSLPFEGHRKQRYWLMAEAFVRAGHQVVYWTSDFSHAKKSARMENADWFGDFDVRYIPTVPYSRNVSFKRIKSHQAYAREWMRIAAAEPPPALIITSIPSISAAEAAITLGQKFNARVVVDVMDAWPETFVRLAPRGLRWLMSLLLLPLKCRARRIYRAADRVVGVAERYREIVRRADYLTARHGIELSAAKVPRTDDRKGIHLVYAGNLGRTYDLDTVVRAVEQNSDFELDVAGFGKFTTKCDRVRFHGMLSATDLRTLLSDCDIGIVPMKDESFVGIPYKFCDYAEAGLKIVSSLRGESAALLSKYGCGEVYNPGEVDDFVRAVRASAKMEEGAARKMCESEFDAHRIYDALVRALVK